MVNVGKYTIYIHIHWSDGLYQKHIFVQVGKFTRHSSENRGMTQNILRQVVRIPNKTPFKFDTTIPGVDSKLREKFEDEALTIEDWRKNLDTFL